MTTIEGMMGESVQTKVHPQLAVETGTTTRGENTSAGSRGYYRQCSISGRSASLPTTMFRPVFA